MIAVAALVPQPLTSLISLPEAGIATPADLEGKTIATAGIPYQADFLETILDGEGLSLDDVEQKDVGLNLLPAVLSGSADAMLGGFLNVEGVDLDERGLDPRVVPVDELGIPTYDELVLVAELRAGRPTTRRRSGCSSPRSSAVREPRFAIPPARPRRCSRPATASSRSSPAPRSTAPCRCCCRRRRRSRSAT